MSRQTISPILAGIDPALAGGVLTMALTDVAGFAAFLYLATRFIL